MIISLNADAFKHISVLIQQISFRILSRKKTAKGCYCFESRRYVISWWNILIQVSVLTVTLNTRFVSMSNAIQTYLEANHFRSQELLIMCDERRPQTTVA